MQSSIVKNNNKVFYMVALFLFVNIIMSGCSKKIDLIKNGISEYSIFISENAAPAEKYAVQEFQNIIKQISDRELPITKAVKPNAKIIYIGFDGIPESLISGLNVSEFGNEEYIIRTVGNDLLIAGGKPRGTLYGVIGFLSDHLGCRWYTKDVYKIPQKADVTFGNIEDRQKPTFEYREAYYPEAHEAEWAMHNRLNPAIRPLPDSLGGSYKIYPFVHTFYLLYITRTWFFLVWCRRNW